MNVLIWPGWIGGAAIGLFVVLLVWSTGKPLGCSTAYGNVCGLVSKQPFFHAGKYQTPNNWRLWFSLGLPIGGLLALLLSPGASFEPSFGMGARYAMVMPESLLLQSATVFAGGTLIGVGARLAGGCQSGHAIMGMSLLNWPSFVAGGGFFVGGIISVQTLFYLFASQ